MKMSPREKSLKDRLGPSRFSGAGFMGDDTRPPEEIMTEDARTLEKLAISKNALIKAMKAAYNSAEAALGGKVETRPGVSAVFYESMGRIPSPFTGDGVFPKGEAVLTEDQTGKQLIITALGIHLIEKHGFFQGKGSRFRIEPELAARMLEP